MTSWCLFKFDAVRLNFESVKCIVIAQCKMLIAMFIDPTQSHWNINNKITDLKRNNKSDWIN